MGLRKEHPEAKGKIRDKDLQRLRALMMVEYKVRNNATYADLAREFKVSQDTVQRDLTFAKRAGLIVKYEDKILEELVPSALKAIKEGMGDENKIEAAKIGLKVLTGVIPGFQKEKASSTPDTSGDLRSYIEQIRGELGDIVDGEVADEAPRALAAAEAEGSEGQIVRVSGGNPGSTELLP